MDKMLIMGNKYKAINNIFLINLLIAFVICVYIMVGQIARWDLLEQISMADHYVKFKTFYPDIHSKELFAVSVYFPGYAFIAYLFTTIGVVSSLPIVVLCFNFLFFLIFIYILNFISKKINTNHSTKLFLSFFIILSFFICNDWLKYVLEAKPDIIAIDLGFLGLFLLERLNSKTILKYTFSSILIGIAILFKQQFVVFYIGIYLSAIIQKDSNLLLVALLSSIFSGAIFLLIYTNQNSNYWNIKVLSDDHHLNLIEITKINYLLLRKIIYIIIILFLLKKIRNIFEFNPKIFYSNNSIHYVIILMIYAFVSLAGVLKAGGNSGNVELGIILLLPIFFSFFNKINFTFITLVASIILLANIKLINESIIRKTENLELKQYIINNLPKSLNDNKILSGSDVYASSRLLKSNYPIDNVRTYAKYLNIEEKEEYKFILEKILNENPVKYSYIIVENTPENEFVLTRAHNYKISFSNKLAIVAILTGIKINK